MHGDFITRINSVMTQMLARWSKFRWNNNSLAFYVVVYLFLISDFTGN